MKDSEIDIRPYQVTDYDRVWQLFTSGLWDGFWPFIKQLFFGKNYVQHSFQFFCFSIGYILTNSFLVAFLSLFIYGILAMTAIYLAIGELIR